MFVNEYFLRFNPQKCITITILIANYLNILIFIRVKHFKNKNENKPVYGLLLPNICHISIVL